MGNILDYLNEIKNAVYGKDMKKSIHDAIKQCYEDGRGGSIDLEGRRILQEEIANRKNAVAKESSERSKEIAVERERINNLASLQEGSTTGDAELMDIRIDSEGNVHGSAGDAVRKQIDSLKDTLKKGITPNMTKGILEWDSYSPPQDGQTNVPLYDNLFPACGYSNDKRIDGSLPPGNYDDGKYYLVIHKIPVKSGDVLRIKGFDLSFGSSKSFRISEATFSTDKSVKLDQNHSKWGQFFSAESDGTIIFTVQNYGTVTNVAYVELCLGKQTGFNVNNVIVTKNQQIVNGDIPPTPEKYEGLRLAKEVGIQSSIGGRNYARNIANPFIKKDNISGANNKTQFGNVYVPNGAKAGDYVTISFDYKALNIVAETGKEATWMIEGEGDVNGWGESRYPHNGNLPINQSGHWTYCTKLLPKAAENNYWKCGVRCDNIASGYLEISNYKLEKGTCETDYTPAYEDLEERIVLLEELERNVDILPQYAEEEYKSTIHTLQSLISPNAFSFAFMTDFHMPCKESNHYQYPRRGALKRGITALKRLTNEFPLTNVVFAGDYYGDWSVASGKQNKQYGLDVYADINKFASGMDTTTIAIAGNHEWKWDGTDTSLGFTDDEFYKLVVSKYLYQFPRIKQANKKVFYMFDDENEVIMVYLNILQYQIEPSAEVKLGIDKIAELNTKNYPLVICCHIGVTSNEERFIDYFQSKNQMLICWIKGHTHNDTNRVYKGVQLISNKCAYGGDSVEVGTVDENAWTVITINKDTRKIYCTRYGAGNDREFSY